MKTKNFFLLISVPFLTCCHFANAQQIQWRNADSIQHMGSIALNFEYWLGTSVSYTYRLPIKKTVLLNTQFSLPVGKKKLDDFKWKIGAQTELLSVKDFSMSARANVILRRYESSLVRILNTGAEAGITIGYYRPHWFAGIDFRYDHAFLSQFRHTDAMRVDFPNIKDGWYKNTGGNIIYSLTGGYSFKKNDFCVNIGLIRTQQLNTTPTIPYFLEVGYNRRF